MHHDPRRPISPTRRQILRATGSLAAAGVAAPFLSSAAKAASTAPAAAGPATWSLEATTSSYTFGDGETIPFFRYEALGGGDSRGALPYFEATEGDPVTVSVSNQLPVPFRPVLRGVTVGPVIPPGATRSFEITMPPAGTYLLANTYRVRVPSGAAGGGVRPSGLSLRPQNRTSGLSATLVSRPVGGGSVLYVGGPSFDREYVHVWDDADDRWNKPSASPLLTLDDYEPNYFTVNGLAAPTSVTDVDSRVVGNVGERILLRQLNAGRLRHTLHFHGYHAEIATRDNVPVTNMPEKDTWPLPAGSTMDLILTPDQAGIFPLHPHHVFAVTANGAYPFGQLVHQDIS